MKLSRLASLFLVLALCGQVQLLAQEIDKELQKLADKLATAIKEQKKTKVTVLDFTDLQGSGTELGRYVAEELTVNLVMAKRDFSVLDRANLRKIMAEHKLTATGLIDPENAKKLGQFAGVDTLILGTLVPKGGGMMTATAKLLTVDTAEIIAAARVEFKSDSEVQKLASQPSSAAPSPTALAVKSFGDLVVEIQSLVVEDGTFYRLEIELKNKSMKKSVWAAVSCEQNGTARFWLRDPEKVEFQSSSQYVQGIEAGSRYYDGSFIHATEIKPAESVSGTIRFRARGSRSPTPGECNVSLEFLSTLSMNSGSGGKATVHSMTARIEAK